MQARKTPLSYGNSPGTNRKARPKCQALNQYTNDCYNRAVQRACEAMYNMPKELQRASRKLSPSQVRRLRDQGGESAVERAEEERHRLLKLAAEWRAKHCWSPNQLRHAAGTDVRRQFGVEAAQVTLGHANLEVTEIYAERNEKLVAEIMQKIG